MRFINGFNKKIALLATRILGSIWCAWAFLIMVMIPLGFPASQLVIMFISSSVLQLVALPLLAVGSALLSEKSEARAEADHKKILLEFDIVKEILADVKSDDVKINTILQRLESIEAKLGIQT